MRLLGICLAIAAAGLAPWVSAQTDVTCGCVDMVLVIDDTGSMGEAIDSVKAGLSNIVASAQLVSGSDVRIGLVTFKDDITVDLPFTTSEAQITAAVNALSASGGAGFPEASDEALKLTITGNASTGCVTNLPSGALGNYRAPCLKIAVLITDALPGGCDDTYTLGVDDVNAANVASAAASAGVRISAVQVGGSTFDTVGSIMMNYADVSGGVYSLVPATGTGTGNAILSILTKCGQYTAPETYLPVTQPAQHDECVTRDSRYWFTHAYSDVPDSATLLRSLFANTSPLPIGFLQLPMEYRNGDDLKDQLDGLIEALGLYYRSDGKTGEESGTQNFKFAGSKLCKERKNLAIELIAAMANNALLGTAPQNCTYSSGKTVVQFPTNLIELAGAAIADASVDRVRAMTTLLKQFNQSGVTSPFVNGLVEPSPQSKKDLKTISRDPTTQSNCPGVNTSCQASAPVLSFPFNDTVDLTKYLDTTGGPTCATGGRNAIYRIAPPQAAPGRGFIIDTEGSNFDTVLSVDEGQCNPLFQIACNDNIDSNLQSRVIFTADGTNTYFIVAEGKNGAFGKLKVRIKSF